MSKFIVDNSAEIKRLKNAANGIETLDMPKAENPSGYAKTVSVSMPGVKTAQASEMGIGSITRTQPQFFSPFHTPMTWQIPARRREIMQWCRFYYSSDCKVAAGVDFYSNFSMNGFKLECKNKKVLKYFETLCKKIGLSEKLNRISHEYYLIGDVFPFLDLECPHCHGRGRLSNGEVCRHKDGTFKAIKLLNPDFMDVRSDPVSDEASYYLLPSEQLKMLVQRRQPIEAYNRLPKSLINIIASGQPIPLNPNSISHIKYNPSDYATYGNPMIQRLFTVLAYKTKLMTANWVVAERLIIPIRVVKVGDKDRPAGDEDLAAAQSQLAQVANDPNLTIVTHNAFEVDYVGATSKIHNITQELEQIGKEILDGLMLNQAILNGEAGAYSSAQVGVEVLIRRLENWRNTLKEWVEEKVFKPVAMMQGFVDEKASKYSDEIAYLYPTLRWNDLQLRDKTSRIQNLMQGFDKKLVSGQTLLEEMNLNYDTETEKIREENIAAAESGMIAGQGGGNLGTMGMGGGITGGGGMPMDLGGDLGGAPMGAPGGDMGVGDMGGGMGGDAGGAPMGAAANNLPKVVKRSEKGRIKNDEEDAAPRMQVIKLTSLERKMYKMLTGMGIPFNLYAQFKVRVPGESRPYNLDFAYPQIGVAIEPSGSIWHEREDFKQRDRLRDQKLANIGWRILRFDEDAISDEYDQVRNVIMEQVKDAAQSMKQKRNKKAQIDLEAKNG